jgi:L-ectoine synthase
VNQFWYANHIEAVFIVEGEGEITDLATGETHQLAPGSLYLLNNHDKHEVRPRTQMRTVCVFNPPITGREVHDENGVYPLVAEPA